MQTMQWTRLHGGYMIACENPQRKNPGETPWRNPQRNPLEKYHGETPGEIPQRNSLAFFGPNPDPNLDCNPKPDATPND